MVEVTAKKPFALFKNGGSVGITLSPVWLRMHGLEKGAKVRQFIDNHGRLVLTAAEESKEIVDDGDGN